MSDYDYDYFVIGAGSGGIRSARIAASLGAKVGVAEYKVIGGTCVNVGCVPKKIMAYAADYSAEFDDARNYGWDIAQPNGFDWKGFIAKKNAEIERLNGIYHSLLDKTSVTYHEGQASLVDKNTVQIGNQTIRAEKILIAVGGTPRRPNIKGAEHIITSDEVFYLEQQPEHILIQGGGYIAVEFAHIFAGLGSKVTLCYRGELFLRGFDADIREILADYMRDHGIDLRFNCDIENIEKSSDILHAKLNTGDTLDCDQVLSAIGRTPNTAGINLETIGIKTAPNGQIEINDQYQTSIENIYALGDVANAFNLTPVATAEGQYLAHQLFGDKDRPAVHYGNITTAVFSRPAIATVGYSEESARDNGYEIEVYKTRFRSMKFILAERQEPIFMKLIVDKSNDRVIGCHMIGLDAPEIMQGFAVAMNAGATKADFDKTIGIHPTSAEEFVTMR